MLQNERELTGEKTARALTGFQQINVLQRRDSLLTDFKRE